VSLVQVFIVMVTVVVCMHVRHVEFLRRRQGDEWLVRDVVRTHGRSRRS
jgi:hypothetical protein